MNFFVAFVLAVVEGVTEFLPVSSTAHLVLASKLLGVSYSSFVSSFEIGIQLGAILAVVVLYFKRVIGKPKLWMKIGLAFLPTAGIGFLVYPLVKSKLLANADLAAVMLVLGGIFLIFWERFHKADKKKMEDLSWWRCVVIGFGQAVSIIPGVSRAMATIVTGVAMGLSRTEAVEMAFLLAVPTMMAATALDIYKSAGGFATSEWVVLVFGMGIAFGSALVSVRWLLNFVKKSDLSGFGWYRIAIGLIWLFA